MKLSIRTRLTASCLVILIAVLAALTVAVPARLARDLSAQTDQSLRERAEQLSTDYTREGEGEFIENANTATSGLMGGQSWAQLLTPGGALIKSTGSAVANTPAFSAEAAGNVLAHGTSMMTAELGPQHQRYRLIARPLSNSRDPRLLVLATSLGLSEGVVGRLTELLVVVGVIAVVLAGTGSWWMSRFALLPVTRISRRAERIRVDHLDERIPEPAANDEVGDLVRTLNGMFDRLREGVEEHRRLVADASHELRTPLAIMRAELDATLSLPRLPELVTRALERNATEVDRMNRLVGNLLTLSRMDRGELELLWSRVDLLTEASTVAGRFEELARTKGIRLQVSGASHQVLADREGIDQVIANLVDNAVKYTSHGTVQIQVWHRTGEVGLTVADTGPGVCEQEAERIFDRFYRVDSARTRTAGGSGLGLAICREIIRAHAGRIWLDSELGEGSRFSFALPSVRGDGVRVMV